MFKLNGIKIGAAFLLLSSTVGANVIIDNQLIPTEDIVNIQIVPGSNTLIINTTDPYVIMRADSGPVTPTNDVVINRFTAAPSTFVEGGSTTIAWETQNANSCTPTGGTAAWRSTSISLDGNGNGSTSIQIAAPNPYTFGLTCTGVNGQSPPRQVIVNVIAESTPQTPANCDAASLPGGIIVDWSTLWGGAFPGPGGHTEIVTGIPQRSYKAFKFNTGNATGQGSVVPVVLSNTTGAWKVSFSECPGDFVTVAPDCRPMVSSGGGIAWSTEDKPRKCHLEQNKDYYFNVTYTDGVSPNSPSCTGACEAKLQYSRY